MATVTTDIVRDFKDLDLNFNIHPVRKDISKSIGPMAVVNSIKNLILTNYYERPFQPDIGSNVRRLLFENLDNITASTIKDEIERTIVNYEPRATVKTINVTADYDNNGFKVYMEFFIVNQNDLLCIDYFFVNQNNYVQYQNLLL
jgi:phage baseplate assembly protein W